MSNRFIRLGLELVNTRGGLRVQVSDYVIDLQHVISPLFSGQNTKAAAPENGAGCRRETRTGFKLVLRESQFHGFHYTSIYFPCASSTALS